LEGRFLEPGQGVADWALRNHQAVYVNNVREDSRWHSGIDEETGFETLSLLCAPLEHQDRVTGVIEVVNKRTGDFNDEDLNLLEAVASIAATAIENARLYADTQARAEELALLNEIGLTLTSTLDYDEVIREAASHVQRLFQADGTFILQADSDADDFCFVHTSSGGRLIEPPPCISDEEGLVGWVVERQRSLLLEDVQADPRFPIGAEEYLEMEMRSLLASPMLTPEGVRGLIAVLSEEAAAFDRDDLHILQTLGSTLAVALENARLYNEQKRLLREREETQAQLIHAEKMSALGRLAASIAHEINNPLQAVQGCLTLVDEEVQSEKRENKLERYLGIAETEIDRISGIVRRMRDFYRPSSKEFEPTDMHQVLDGVLTLANKQLQHADVSVERDWCPDLPLVEANADHLKQVFLNMIINAIDAMPEGGTLRVTTRPDQVRIEEGDPPVAAARVDFQDTGVGMSPDIQERLFEPFFTTKDHGSGLGLSISFNIVRSHKGEILVESEKGKGTIFSILLPVEQVLEVKRND
jgi:signal transduction histidine kinase